MRLTVTAKHPQIGKFQALAELEFAAPAVNGNVNARRSG
jgi:hypothetical protein